MTPTSRRSFLRGGFLRVLNENAALPERLTGEPPGRPEPPRPVEKPLVTVGIVTDIHYADAEPRGSRHYRESLSRMREAADVFSRRNIDVAIELGDLIDAGPKPDVGLELNWLRQIDTEFARAGSDRHYVLGNHCVTTLTKAEFLRAVGRRGSHYSFDRNGVHFVILDGCFKRDGAAYQAGNFAWNESEIPPAQRDWLAADLDATRLPTLVFCHQRLDTLATSDYAIHSAADVRQILERSGKVKAVFSGHSHQNELDMVHEIPYVTLAAMVEGTGPTAGGYSIVSVYASGALSLEGFRHHAEHPLAAARPTEPDSGRRRSG